MTTKDISEQIKELYEIEISAQTVSNITNRILPLVSEWQNIRLVKMYSITFMDKKAFVGDLKSVYTSVTESVAMENLIEIKEKWDCKYPHTIKS